MPYLCSAAAAHPRLAPIGRLGYHLNVTLPIDDRADPGTDQVVVFDEHHPNRPALSGH